MIKLPTKIFNAIEAVRKGPVIEEMTNITLVIWYLNSVKEPEAAEWIRLNPMAYRAGLLEGFCIDNSQEQQLKDMHNV